MFLFNYDERNGAPLWYNGQVRLRLRYEHIYTWSSFLCVLKEYECLGTVFFVMFQREFQTFLVVISIISAIWMLAAKPAIIKITQRRSTRVSWRLNVGAWLVTWILRYFEKYTVLFCICCQGFGMLVNFETRSMSSGDDTAQIFSGASDGIESKVTISPAPASAHVADRYEVFPRICFS